MPGDPELRGTGRHLDADELFAWTRFLDASRLIEQLLAHHLTTRHSMTLSDYEVLVRLDGAGDTMRLSVLADQCVSSKSKLTHTLDRLEHRGWITRSRAQADRRGVEAHLTQIGADALERAAVGNAALIRRHLLDVWTDAEQATIGQVMDRVSQRIRGQSGRDEDDPPP